MKNLNGKSVDFQTSGALSRKDAAAYLSISTRQLDKYAAIGLIPRVKLGVKSVFRVSDLDAFLASRLESTEAACDE